MTITRKNYEAIASIFSTHSSGCSNCGDMETITDIINDLATYFKQDTPKFDSSLFIKACGPKWACENCGKALTHFNKDNNGLCYDCWDRLAKGELL